MGPTGFRNWLRRCNDELSERPNVTCVHCALCRQCAFCTEHCALSTVHCVQYLSTVCREQFAISIISGRHRFAICKTSSNCCNFLLLLKTESLQRICVENKVICPSK